MASSSRQRNVSMNPVKPEPVDVIWLSSDDEGDNVYQRSQRFERRVANRDANRDANRVANSVANNVAQRTANNVAQRTANNVANNAGKRRVDNNVAQRVIKDMNEICEWITQVTPAMQNLKRKQTLHIPAWVVKRALKDKCEIYLRSAETKRTYDCAILDPGRSSQRYIGDGWYDFVEVHRPKVGDVLHFSLKPPYNLMVVSLMRQKPRTR
ncbi:unnamed protein product [Trifolium pratense]|uniref:Uncharacterized protein n=1 Tax=Trifolium pratense TaxID=57577 RepID=A0ACB0JPH6_TRIPR|nr:unnamed protein product [Trifolium pratense]